MDERETRLTDVEVVAAVIEKYHPRLSPLQAIVEANAIVAKLRTLRSVEPPREMVVMARAIAHDAVMCMSRTDEESRLHGNSCDRLTKVIAASFTALRSQTLDEAARKIKDEAETIMRDYVMTGPAGIVKGCIAAIRALPLPPGIK